MITLSDCKCPECGTRYGERYCDHDTDADGDPIAIVCGRCNAVAGVDDVMHWRGVELDAQREDAMERRAEARREAAYERRRGVE